MNLRNMNVIRLVVYSWYIHLLFINLIYIFRLVFRYKNQNVAVKIVQRGDAPEEIAKREARFGREVAMLSRVQHKNLVKVYGKYTSTCRRVHLPMSVTCWKLVVRFYNFQKPNPQIFCWLIAWFLYNFIISYINSCW